MAIVETAASDDDAAALDKLLWQVLWEPLGLPRDVRRSLALEGPELELLAREQGRLVGGLVAVRRPGGATELRHLAVAAPAQGRGVGRVLVTELCRSAAGEGSPRLQVIARSSSAGFFRALGFRRLPGLAPTHPAFAAHGISFERMEKALQGDAAAERPARGPKAGSSGAQAPVLRSFRGRRSGRRA